MKSSALTEVENFNFTSDSFSPDPSVKKLYKVYNDGGHYIATRVIRSQLKVKGHSHEKSDIDYLFDNLYRNARVSGLKDRKMREYIKTGIVDLFPDCSDTDDYIEKKTERAKKNFWKRVKRFRRKAYLNKWNYFVTLTYDDKKHTAETFRKKIRRCLSNLHTRRGWRYMGVFEEAPETGRLHFHGIMYIPDGEMIGKVEKKSDYSTAQNKMQTRHENNFFVENFGRNDFEELNEMEMKSGQAIKYLLKYVGKTGERIVYSRGIKSEVIAEFPDSEIVTEMNDYGTKYILFDDSLDWERDIMRFTYRQLSFADILCNSLRSA